MRISKTKLRKLIREACDILGTDDFDRELDFTQAIDPDVPVPADYDAVTGLLNNNDELADLALSFIMIKAGASCEKSSAQAIIDHLQNKIESQAGQPLEWEADGIPGKQLDIKEELRKTQFQDLSTPIPIDDLQFVDEEGYGAMMFPGAGHSYSVREENFEAEKEKLKKRYGEDVMISVPDPRYPKAKKIHSNKFNQAQSRENQNFMRHQQMMRKRLGREPSLGS